ncbi:Late embryogenesis abundant protein [Vigna unguiculata]|uniref:Late embryogenesis abundant protein n=1 Tax=Vigna unguiculata TaxID=3917 RepID=A0A4D6L0G5_VIGUN|nr:Late embryogenesis abundant protein [Vigna unguiculata]
MEQEKQRKTESESEKERLEGLPIEDSPYVQYKDLEDYKQQGYGTQGHQEPKTGRGAGATEAPTLSGAALSSQSEATATGANNHKGVP